MKNPLLMDPTRTSALRGRFIAALRVRFQKVKRELVDFLIVKDALDLEDDRKLAVNAAPKEYQFNTDPQKLEAFNDWFAQMVAAGVFIPDPGTPPGQPWTTQYVLSAYKQGLISAYLSSKASGMLQMDAQESLSQEQFLRSAFMGPEAMDKVRLLATRTYSDMRGITTEMGVQLSRLLAQGLIDGISAVPLAREMTRQIDKLTNTRALVLARTEIIRAHAQGQLDSFRRLGVEELGVQAEFSTAHDGRVCPECAAHEGKIYTLDQASGLIPLHPNCRCSWLPYVPSLSSRK